MSYQRRALRNTYKYLVRLAPELERLEPWLSE